VFILARPTANKRTGCSLEDLADVRIINALLESKKNALARRTAAPRAWHNRVRSLVRGIVRASAWRNASSTTSDLIVSNELLEATKRGGDSLV
jgi:hypothetical protein